MNKRKSLKKAEQYVEHLKKSFEGFRVGNITTDRIKGHIDCRINEGLANATINRELSALKRMFSLASECTPRKVREIPHIPMLKESNVRKGFFEYDQFVAVKEALPDYLKSLATLAYHIGWLDQKEIAGIEGFDEDTARELQERAKEYIGAQEAELDAKRTELGVEDAVKDVPGVTTKMLVALGENGVKTVEDLAGCATDDLTGWTERKDGESKHEPGYLEGFDISRADAEALIMQARLKVGWVTEAELAPPPAEPAEAEAPQPQA